MHRISYSLNTCFFSVLIVFFQRFGIIEVALFVGQEIKIFRMVINIGRNYCILCAILTDFEFIMKSQLCFFYKKNSTNFNKIAELMNFWKKKLTFWNVEKLVKILTKHFKTCRMYVVAFLRDSLHI